MKRLSVAPLMSSLLSAVLALAAVAPSESASAQAGSASFGPNKQTLFECRTDRVETLRKLSDGSYVARNKRSIRGEVRLIIDTDTHAMTLFVRSQGETTGRYALRDVEQGSHLGSGASGMADTIVRGQSDGKVFTLFAGYENNIVDHLSLEVAGSHTLLLFCSGAQFSSPLVTGVGRRGMTNIYTLGYDGLARTIKEEDLPEEPDR